DVFLHQRRVFIFPTRYGLTFAASLLAMLAGSINYDLSLGFVLTFFLALVIWRVAVLEVRPIAGVLIGLTVMMGIAAAGPLTGVALNPARAFGPALFLGDWTAHWIMWLVRSSARHSARSPRSGWNRRGSRRTPANRPHGREGKCRHDLIHRTSANLEFG
ncbi:MAG: aquaporin, partial [Pleurocapsa sp. SU_196_0]|nr:aquaporin [Pleurocapsa sp. SU_196_0]